MYTLSGFQESTPVAINIGTLRAKSFINDFNLKDSKNAFLNTHFKCRNSKLCYIYTATPNFVAVILKSH